MAARRKKMGKFAVVLPAAGRSSRFKDEYYKKPLRALGRQGGMAAFGRAILATQRRRAGADRRCRADDRESFNFKFGSNVAILGIDVVQGGAERSDSVAAALARVKPDAEFVCVHDAARPCLADAWIDNVFRAAEKCGAAILAVPVSATLKRVRDNREIHERDR